MHLLLAEDDKISRDLLRRIIESESHKVTLAHDGEEAWAQLLKVGPDLDACILDICMPQMSGLDLVQRMRANDALKRLPVMLCTAVHDRATVQRAAALGVAHYVLKPYSRSGMLEKLRQIRAAKQDDSCGAIEEPALVCRRLGIDSGFHREMVSTVLEEALGFLRELHADQPDFSKLFIRARGLNGSCLTFGLRRAAQKLAQIEGLLQSLSASPENAATARTGLLAPIDELDRDLAQIREWLGPTAPAAGPGATSASAAIPASAASPASAATA
ncbi:MAG: response regulator [Opitutaceae bacterium]